LSLDIFGNMLLPMLLDALFKDCPRRQTMKRGRIADVCGIKARSYRGCSERKTVRQNARPGKEEGEPPRDDFRRKPDAGKPPTRVWATAE
jgi:hypothetical protein